MMDAAWAAGINVFDTAASYGGGRSESWVGAWRSERKAPVLLSTKVFWSVTGDPDDRGLGRERIRRQLDGSLGRLGHGAGRPVPHARAGRGHADRGDAATLRRGRPGREGRRDRREQPRRRGPRGGARDEHAARARPLRLGAERVLPAAPRGRARDPADLRARGARLHAVRPARRRLADRQVPARRGVPCGLADDAAPGPVRDLVDDRVVRRARRPSRAAAAERGVEMATLAFAWVLGHPQVDGGGRRAAAAGAPRTAVAATELELSPGERDELAGFFA